MAGKATRVVGEVGIKARPVSDGFWEDLKQQLRRVEARAKRNPIFVPIEAGGDLPRQVREQVARASGQEVHVAVDVDEAPAKSAFGNIRREIDGARASVDKFATSSRKTFKDLQKQRIDVIVDTAKAHKQLSGLRAAVPNLMRPDARGLTWGVGAPDISDVRRRLQEQFSRPVFAPVRPVLSKLGLLTAHAQLQRSVDAATRGVKANVPAQIASSPASVAKFKSSSQALLRGLKLVAPVALKVSKASLAKFATTMKSISGYNVFVKISGDMGDMITRFDKLAQSVGGIGVVVGGVMTLVAGMGGSLLATASDLAKIVHLGWLIPGFLGAAAMSAVVFASAMKDVGTVFADLKPVFSDLQKSMSGNFWAEAAQPIRDLVYTHLPALNAGFSAVATSMGRNVGTFASSLSHALGGGQLEFMFGQLDGFFTNAQGSAAALGSIIATLGVEGAKWLPQLGQWVTDIATEFDSWLTRMSEDGTIARWVQQGIDQLNNLFSIIYSTGSIGSSLAGIADAAGFTGLDGIADLLKGARESIEKSGVKEALTEMFTGAKAGMDAFGDGLKGLGDGFISLAPHLRPVMESIGGVFGELAKGLGAIISDPAFHQGLTDLFSGLLDGVKALDPVFKSMGPFLGAIGTAVGQFFSALGPVFAALADMGPVFGDLMAAVGDLSAVLVGALGEALVALLPPILDLVRVLLPPLTDLISQVAAWVAPLAQALAPIISAMLQPLGDFLAAYLPKISEFVSAYMPTILDILQQFTPAYEQMLPVLLELLNAVLTPMMDLLIQIGPEIASLVSNVLPQVMPVLMALIGLIGSLVPLISGTVQLATGLIGGSITFMTSLFQGFMATVGSVWGVILAVIEGAVNTIREQILGFVSLVTGDWDGFISHMDNANQEFFGNMPKKIGDAIGNVGDVLFNAGKNILDGFWRGLQSAWGGIKNFISGIANWIAQHKGPESYDKQLLVRHGGWIMEGLDKGLEDGFGTVQARVQRMAPGIESAFGSASLSAGVAGSRDGGYGAQIVVNPAPGMDETLIGQVAASRMAREMRRFA